LLCCVANDTADHPNDLESIWQQKACVVSWVIVRFTLPSPFSAWPTANSTDIDPCTHTNHQLDIRSHGGILYAQLPMTGSLCCLSQCQCNAAGIAQSISIINLSIQEQPIAQMLCALMQQIHTCLRSDTAATGSVAATMAPNRKL